jgi:GntR family transcriptional repressor for pyruvate dehydrogenase complex
MYFSKELIHIEVGARISAVQQVEESLRQYVLSDEIQIGDKLPTEKQLCSDLNVGRGTVREAIRLLQAKGLVEIRPNRGAFVLQKREMQPDDIVGWFHDNEFQLRDLNDIRTAIEPLAVKLAIQRCSDDEIRHLQDIHNQSVLAAQRNDPPELARLDEAFHSYIFECARNKPLADINRKVVDGLTAFRSKTFYFPRNIQNFIPAHAAILQAFEKRDITMGQANMIAHLELVASDLTQSTQSAKE